MLSSALLAADAVHEMTLVEAIILGITEGLTEYLPVSSTGHLLLASHVLGLTEGTRKAASDSYSIAIQIGAILAVLWLYPGRVFSMIKGLMGRDRAGLNLAINTCAAFLPAAVIGLTFGTMIKEYLFGLWPITFAWLAGGLAILLVARHFKGSDHSRDLSLEGLTIKKSLIIGLIQCIAMWPGVSRSLVTILGGMLVGLPVAASVEFSFLLGLVTLGAATSYELLKEGPGIILQFGLVSPAVGIMAAFFSAVAAVKWMVNYLNRHGLEIFGYYRVALALGVGVLILTGLL